MGLKSLRKTGAVENEIDIDDLPDGFGARPPAAPKAPPAPMPVVEEVEAAKPGEFGARSAPGEKMAPGAKPFRAVGASAVRAEPVPAPVVAPPPVAVEEEVEFDAPPAVAAPVHAAAAPPAPVKVPLAEITPRLAAGVKAAYAEFRKEASEAGAPWAGKMRAPGSTRDATGAIEYFSHHPDAVIGTPAADHQAARTAALVRRAVFEVAEIAQHDKDFKAVVPVIAVPRHPDADPAALFASVEKIAAVEFGERNNSGGMHLKTYGSLSYEAACVAVESWRRDLQERSLEQREFRIGRADERTVINLIAACGRLGVDVDWSTPSVRAVLEKNGFAYKTWDGRTKVIFNPNDRIASAAAISALFDRYGIRPQAPMAALPQSIATRAEMIRNERIALATKEPEVEVGREGPGI